MDWQWFIAVIGVPAVGSLIWWTVRLQARIGATERDLSHFMIKAAETYVTKGDLHAFESTVTARFDKLDQKLDRLLSVGPCAPRKQ